MKQLISILFILFHLIALSQKSNYRLEEYDVKKYTVDLQANPTDSEITVVAKLQILFKSDLETLYLDLHSKEGKNGKGMQILKVVDLKYDDTLNFEHKEDEVRIRSIRFKKDYETTLEVTYSGQPKDGLIISKNKFLHPTIFADNWPNRGHHWLISNDHPSDKALWEVTVTTPAKYKVVSNGSLIYDSVKTDSIRTVNYKTQYELPTKVMVVGIADFAIDSAGFSGKIPVTSWVFPENEEKGFHDYAQAVEVLDWFVKKITPYPFEKLANVQSKTIFGGMENAGCIFYFENSVTGKRNHEDLLAHEIAHQWFGNSASEKDWQHIWLSEGFATYLTDLYILEKYGTVEFEKRMQQERNKVISFYKKSPSPIVNTTSDLMSMLNANSYQKGAWVLHMLREKVGSVIFWEILQNYYNRFAYSNADTEDFFQVVEEVSGKKMDQFKKQWLHSAQIPELKITTKIKGKSFEIIVEQLQNELFHFDLDIGIIGKEDAEVFSISNIEKKVTTLTYKTKFKILKLDFDPNMKLLFLKQ